MNDQKRVPAQRGAAVLSCAHIRGARGALGWSMHDLAKAAQVSVSTVKRIETPGLSSVSEETKTAVRRSLEAAGVRFLTDEQGGVGVWLSMGD